MVVVHHLTKVTDKKVVVDLLIQKEAVEVVKMVYSSFVVVCLIKEQINQIHQIVVDILVAVVGLATTVEEM